MDKFVYYLAFWIVSFLLASAMITLSQNSIEKNNLTGYFTLLTVGSESGTSDTTTDHNKPQIYIYPPEPNYYSGEVIINGNVYSPDKKIITIIATADDSGEWVEIPLSESAIASGYNEDWSYPVDTTTLPDGTHTFRIIAVDDTGTNSEPAGISVSTDNTAPEVFFSTTRFAEGDVNLLFEINDETTGVKSTDAITYTVTGSDGNTAGSGNPRCSGECIGNPAQSCFCKVSIPSLEAGNYQLTVSATDSALPENTGETINEFIVNAAETLEPVDDTPPQIHSEMPDEVFAGEIFSIDIKAVDDTGLRACSIFVDSSELTSMGIPLPCSECSASKEISIDSHGDHVITISCTDSSANENTVEKTIYVKPAMDVTDSGTTSTTDTETTTATDTTDTTGDETTGATDTTHDETTTLTDETKAVPMIYEMKLNEGNEFTNQRQINIFFSASEVIQCRIKNEGENWSEWSEVKDVYCLTLPEGDGEKAVLMQCENEAGDLVEAKRSITLDSQSPMIFEVSPSSDLTVNKNKMQFIARIGDNLSKLRSCEFEVYLNEEKTEKTRLRESEDKCVLEIGNLQKGDVLKVNVRAIDTAGNKSNLVSFGTAQIQPAKIGADTADPDGGSEPGNSTTGTLTPVKVSLDMKILLVASKNNEGNCVEEIVRGNRTFVLANAQVTPQDAEAEKNLKVFVTGPKNEAIKASKIEKIKLCNKEYSNVFALEKQFDFAGVDSWVVRVDARTIDSGRHDLQANDSIQFRIKEEKIQIELVGDIRKTSDEKNTYELTFRTKYDSSEDIPEVVTVKVGNQIVEAKKTGDGSYTLVLQEEQLSANLMAEDGFGNMGVINLPKMPVDVSASMQASRPEEKTASLLALLFPIVLYAFIFAVLITGAYYYWSKKHAWKRKINKQITEKKKEIESISHLIKASKIEYFKRHISEETLKKRVLEYQDKSNTLEREISGLEKQVNQRKIISDILKR